MTTKKSENKAETTHRVQLDFSEKSFEQLENLQKQAKHETRAETIRNALSLYQWYVDAKDNGSSVMLKDPDRSVVKINFEGL